MKAAEPFARYAYVRTRITRTPSLLLIPW
jgi:hypothetical protein